MYRVQPEHLPLPVLSDCTSWSLHLRPEIEFEVKLMRIKPTEERRGTQRPGQESRASGAN